MPNIDFSMSMGLAPDVPIEQQYQKRYAMVITAANQACLNDLIDIAAAVIGSRNS